MMMMMIMCVCARLHMHKAAQQICIVSIVNKHKCRVWIAVAMFACHPSVYLLLLRQILCTGLDIQSAPRKMHKSIRSQPQSPEYIMHHMRYRVSISISNQPAFSPFIASQDTKKQRLCYVRGLDTRQMQNHMRIYFAYEFLTINNLCQLAFYKIQNWRSAQTVN